MGFKKEPLLHVKYYSFGATGSGISAADPASPVDGDIFAIPAGAVISGCDVIITSAVTGDIDIGDDDDPNGFVATAGVTEGTPGLYVGAGAYLASGAKKYYSATGKEVKLDATTISAGAFTVVLHGYHT